MSVEYVSERGMQSSKGDLSSPLFFLDVQCRPKKNATFSYFNAKGKANCPPPPPPSLALILLSQQIKQKCYSYGLFYGKPIRTDVDVKVAGNSDVQRGRKFNDWTYEMKPIRVCTSETKSI